MLNKRQTDNVIYHHYQHQASVTFFFSFFFLNASIQQERANGQKHGGRDRQKKLGRVILLHSFKKKKKSMFLLVYTALSGVHIPSGPHCCSVLCEEHQAGLASSLCIFLAAIKHNTSVTAGLNQAFN